MKKNDFVQSQEVHQTISSKKFIDLYLKSFQTALENEMKYPPSPIWRICSNIVAELVIDALSWSFGEYVDFLNQYDSVDRKKIVRTIQRGEKKILSDHGCRWVQHSIRPRAYRPKNGYFEKIEEA